MRRRELIAGLSGVAAWPLAARAQQPEMPVVGFVSGGSAVAFTTFVSAFHKGLSEGGYVDGQNAKVEYHWLEGQYNRLPAVMADLVRRRVAVIAAPGSDIIAPAAKAATTVIPIVFGVAQDPVKLGLVASLARPSSNATGVNFLVGEVVAKRLGLLHELVPKAVRVAVLLNPANTVSAHRYFAARRRHMAPLDCRHHTPEQVQVVLVAVRFGVKVGRHLCETLAGVALHVLLHKSVIGAPGNAGGAYSCLLRPCRNLMGMQIMQTKLIDQRLLDLLVEDKKAVRLDHAAAELERFWHVPVDVNRPAIQTVAGEIGMSCLRSKFFTRRMTASSARSIIRLDTYHSGIRSFLCGATGWQKLRGMLASRAQKP
jgi:hypothetical protein